MAVILLFEQADCLSMSEYLRPRLVSSLYIFGQDGINALSIESKLHFAIVGLAVVSVFDLADVLLLKVRPKDDFLVVHLSFSSSF